MAGDTEAANRLFVEAVRFWNQAEALEKDGAGKARARADLLLGVTRNLDMIVSDYSGSDLAVQLILGESIGPLSIESANAAFEDAHQGLARLECLEAPDTDCLFAVAVEALSEMGEESLRWEAPFVITTLAEAGRGEAALALMRDTGHDEDNALLIEIASALGSADLLRSATERALKGPRNDDTDQDLGIIIATMAQLGLEGQDGPAWQAISDTDRAHGPLVHAMLHLGDAERALDHAHKVRDTKRRSQAIGEIVLHLWDAGQGEEALALLDQVDDFGIRRWAHIELGRALKDADMVRSAMSPGGHDGDAVRDLPIRHGAEALAEIGYIDEAMKSADVLDTWAKHDLLRAISEIQAEAGAFDEAVETVNLIESDLDRRRATGGIAVARAKGGQLAPALEILEPYGVDIEFLLDRCFIAMALADAGEPLEALEALQPLEPDFMCYPGAVAHIAKEMAS